MLSHAEVRKVIYDVLKEAGLTKEVNTKTGPKTVIDWKKVYADETGTNALIRQVFENKLKDDGTRLYTDSDIDRIVEVIGKEAEDTLRAKEAKCS